MKHYSIDSSLFFLLLIMFLILPFHLISISLKKENLSWLKTHGTKIVDLNMDEVVLRGCNYILVRTCTEDLFRLPERFEFEQMADWGFNLVRLVIDWEHIEPNPGEYDYKWLTQFVDPVVFWAGELGMYVQIDMHQWYASSHFTHVEGVYGCAGHGFPIWLVKGYDNSAEGQRRFWEDFWHDTVIGYEGEAWDKYSELWKMIARRYQNFSQIVGYDIYNEPYLPNTCYAQLTGDENYVPSQTEEEELNAQILPIFYEYIMERIRKVDSDHILFFEGQDGDVKPSLKLPNIKNIALSVHLHSSETSSYSTLSEIAYRGIDRAREWGIPILNTEFYAPAYSGISFAENIIVIYGNENVGWCWWTYGPKDGNNGALVTESYQEKPITEVLIKYSKKPKIESVSINQKNGPIGTIFTLNVSVKDSFNLTNVSLKVFDPHEVEIEYLFLKETTKKGIFQGFWDSSNVDPATYLLLVEVDKKFVGKAFQDLKISVYEAYCVIVGSRDVLGFPILGARVKIFPKIVTNDVLFLEGTTDSKGRATIKDVPSGASTLLITYWGQTIICDLDLSGNTKKDAVFPISLNTNIVFIVLLLSSMLFVLIIQNSRLQV